MKMVQAKGKIKIFLHCIIAVCIIAGYSLPISAAVVVTEDQTVANKFIRHTVTGITTPLPQLPDVPGFIGAAFLTVADVDKNGVKEIIATSGVGADSDGATPNGEVALFTWDGINKDAWTQTILNNTFAFPNETIARDVDKDGDIDIVVLDQFLFGTDPGGVFYLENQGGNIASPSNWIKRIIYEDTTPDSYHRAYFVDLDGDGDDDVVTMNFYAQWTGWCENKGNGTYVTHTVGTGGGSLFTMFDIDQDGDLDIVTSQLAITTSTFNCVVRGGLGGSDPLGDSFIWFENPGQAALAANPDLAWNRHTIDNWYTSSNPTGKGFEMVVSDIDKDGVSELVVSTHNHQNRDGALKRIWPGGIFYFEIPGLNGNPGDPKVTGDWVPITIETGNPSFVYSNGAPRRTDPYNDSAVWADVYAVDRRGTFYDQGSPGMVRAADVTGDGRTDLVVAGDGKGRLYYYEAAAPSEGKLTFKRASLYSDLQSMPGDATIADIDGDGVLDIVASVFDTSVTKPAPPYKSSSIFFFENTLEITLVELVSFTAQPLHRAVRLTWSTASEIDNAGFNLYRAESEDGPYVKVNDALISAEGSSVQGASYEFINKNLKNRKTYYYKLEDVDGSGQSTFHGPVSAKPNLFNWLTF